MKTIRKKILIVDDQRDYIESLASALEDEYDVRTALSFTEFQEQPWHQSDMILLDVRLNNGVTNNRDGLEILKLVMKTDPEMSVVMMTAFGDVDIAVEAMKLGAADFIQKASVDILELRKVISNNLERTKLKRQVQELKNELRKYQPAEIIGSSAIIQEIRSQVEMVSRDARITVLLRGATGTGKELLARSIYESGPRKNEPFVVVSIASLGKGVVESELFGHEKGSYTGASSRKIGYIEKADRGTLFLDEIGDLDNEVQVKLLRFLDNKTLQRMGSTEEIKVDIQLIAATHQNLEQLINDGKFREDLYFRLRTIQIILPNLFERACDIAMIARYFLNIFHREGRTKLSEFSDEALSLLSKYTWPGNVRELKSCIERAIIYAEYNLHNCILPDDLPREVQNNDHSLHRILIDAQADDFDINRNLARFELAAIERALEQCHKSKSEAWKLLKYNDRHALRRRVIILKSKYPEIMSDYRTIKDLYDG
jgi:DNA-binding NtrC family response regulator